MERRKKKRATKQRRTRRRLAPAEREQLIVEGAIRFFAEVGFGGQTRELARRLGITQPLLYRYFPDKEHLIERVYREVYLKRWQTRWEDIIVDRSRPLRERLIHLYHEYTHTIFNYEWVRIFMFAGLKGVNINRRYLRLVREKLFIPICTELRDMTGLPDPEKVPLMEQEIELVAALHGGIYYAAIRKWIYGLPIPKDFDSHIERLVSLFIRGAPPTLREHFGALRRKA